MKYEKEIIESNLYEVSKSEKSGALLSPRTQKHKVYNLDKLKEEFCRNYRHSRNLSSCDAYYCDRHEHLVIEFKNTGYQGLKHYYDEIEIKIVDTHMLLAETFYRNKKNADLSRDLKFLLVYKNGLNYDKGVRGIDKALTGMNPKKGDAARNAKQKELFEHEAEFQAAVEETKNKYEGEFYKEIRFIEKEDFEKEYIEAEYFKNLE